MAKRGRKPNKKINTDDMHQIFFMLTIGTNAKTIAKIFNTTQKKISKINESFIEKQKQSSNYTFVGPNLSKKNLFRIDEVADFFDVTNRCIRLWIQHGHLKTEEKNGLEFITASSIKTCKFNTAVNK